MAYFLSKGCETSKGEDILTYDGSIWGQSIGSDKIPVLNGATVYANIVYYGCYENEEDIQYVYANQEKEPKVTHHIQYVEAVEPTCENEGQDEYWVCTSCNRIFSDSDGKYELDSIPVIPVIDHIIVKIDGAAPTCTEDGLTDGKMCSMCKKIFEPQEAIPALGHSWDEGVVTVEPTALDKGIVTYTCTVCSATKTKEIPACGETLKKTNGKWYYIKDGSQDTSVTKLIKYGAKWYYVKKGVVDFTATTLVKHNARWYYVKKGVIDFTYSGLVKYSNSWYYVYKGVVDFKSVTLVKYNAKWYYVKSGKVDFKYTGNVTYKGSVYYVKNGVMQKKVK